MTPASTTIARCPACGEPLGATLQAMCPLCGFRFPDYDRATGEDVTPYAAGHAQRKRGWHSMCEWVWFAGNRRLKHLALMRASAASARFARINLLLLFLGLGLFQATREGWREVSRSPAIDARMEPVGDGWFRIATAPPELIQDLPEDAAATLWWNPAQGIVAAVAGFLAAALLSWLVLLTVRAGTTHAHPPPYRLEKRMTAALHYATAWALPIFAGVVVVSLRPIAYVGAVARWSWYPPQYGFELAGSVILAFGAALWWFWLLRLAATAPARAQARVIAFFAVGVPLAVAAAGTVWWFGLDALYRSLFESMKLTF